METDLTNLTATAFWTLQIQTRRKTEPLWRSSKDRNFATKKSASVLKIERGVLKIEVVVRGDLAQLVVPIASGNLQIGTILPKIGKNKATKQSG